MCTEHDHTCLLHRNPNRTETKLELCGFEIAGSGKKCLAILFRDDSTCPSVRVNDTDRGFTHYSWTTDTLVDGVGGG